MNYHLNTRHCSLCFDEEKTANANKTLRIKCVIKCASYPGGKKEEEEKIEYIPLDQTE